MRNKILLGAIITLIICFSFIFDNKNKDDKTDYLDKVESITIYSVDTQSAMNYNSEKLSKINFFIIDKPKNYFSKITYKNKMVIWKGDTLGMVHMKDGSKFKIRISNYGQFFSLIGKNGYYVYTKA